MKKKFLALFVCMAIVLSLAGCASGGGNKTEANADMQFKAASYPYTFTDSSGNEVTLKEKPKKVAVLFSSYADIWNLSGGTVDITVGESVERGFANEKAVLVDEGAGHGEINLEQLTNAAPDFVIGTADYAGQVEAVDFCREKGIASAVFKVESVEDYLKVLKIFCEINDNEEGYKSSGTDVAERCSKIRLAAEKQAEDSNGEAKKILFIRAGSSAKSTKAKTSEDNFACAMLKQLGAANIADGSKVLSGELSLEVIIEENPDHIFITTMGDEAAAKDYINSLFTSDGWNKLDCVKNGKYTFLEKNLFHFKPNAQWDRAYEVLAKTLYPDISFE